MNEQNKKFDFHKVFAAIGIILIAIIIIGGGIWYFVQSAEDKVSTDNSTTVKVSTSSAKPKTATESSAKQQLIKSYTDKFFNVSYNYPDSWEEKAQSGIEACEPRVGPFGVKGSGVSACTFVQNSALTEADMGKSISSQRSILTVAGKSAIRQVLTGKSDVTVSAYIDNVTFKGQTGALVVTGWVKNSGLSTEKFIELFDHILSTFKFL